MPVVKQSFLCPDPVVTDMLSKAHLNGYYPVALSAVHMFLQLSLNSNA